METLTPAQRGVRDRKALAAMLDWWREAGVDHDFTEAPASWLREPPAETPLPPPPPVTMSTRPSSPVERALARAESGTHFGGEPAGWPQDLAAFRNWWMEAGSLGSAAAEQRRAPEGPADAAIGIMTPFPLSDAETSFVSALLHAMGFSRGEAYFASALPAASNLPDWPALSQHGLAALTRHHLGLARPARLLAFDRVLAPVFDIAQAEAREAQTLTLASSSLPLLIVPGLAELARSAERRKAFWNRWLDWTA